MLVKDTWLGDIEVPYVEDTPENAQDAKSFIHNLIIMGRIYVEGEETPTMNHSHKVVSVNGVKTIKRIAFIL